MDKFLDFFNIYFIGTAQILTGFYFLCKFLNKKLTSFYYVLFTICSFPVIHWISGRTAELLVYFLLLTAGGIFLCRADKVTVLLYAALTIEIMQLCYGIVHSLLHMLYPLMSPYPHKFVGIAILLLGNTALLAAAFCYRLVIRYFLCDEALKKQHVFLILTPILFIFLMGEYISTIIYRTDSDVKHDQMFWIQLLGMASLFCMLTAYKKLLENFRLSTELSLLEQEERSLNQYVEEAKTRYERTRSFRHDITNHITVVKELLQGGKTEKALNYLRDMGEMTEGLSFPCCTNNPVADILIGNKLGIAKSMGIDASCSLCLPFPCQIRDIDIGIVLSNALDNAVHACKQMDPHTERFIRVTGRRQGDFLLIEVENSFEGDKLPRKGTGLSNVKAVTERYHGAMSIKTSHAAFTLSVLLIIPQHSEYISHQNH